MNVNKTGHNHCPGPYPFHLPPHPTGQKYMGEGSIIRFVIKWGGIETEGGGREGEVTLLSRESKQCCYKHDSDTIKTSIQHTHIHSIHTQSYTQLRDPYITYLLRRTSHVNHSWDNTQQISNIWHTVNKAHIRIYLYFLFTFKYFFKNILRLKRINVFFSVCKIFFNRYKIFIVKWLVKI